MPYYSNDVDISKLIGKTIVFMADNHIGTDDIEFRTSDDLTYHMYHSQDCCESVELNDVCGDWDDIIGSPVTMAECVTNTETRPDGTVVPKYDSETWTFYKIGTNKGSVTLRWLGESNGYYSEGVDFAETGLIEKDKGE